MLVDIAVKFTYRSHKLLRDACGKAGHSSGLPRRQAKPAQLFVVIRTLSPGAQKPDPTTIRANPLRPSPENRPVEYGQPIETEPICLIRRGKDAGPGEMVHLDHRTKNSRRSSRAWFDHSADHVPPRRRGHPTPRSQNEGWRHDQGSISLP